MYAPLLYVDLEGISDLFATEAALCGVAVGPKPRNRDLIRRAVPRKVSAKHGWFDLILEHWDSVKPKSEGSVPLYQWADKRWAANVTRQSTKAAAQS